MILFDLLGRRWVWLVGVYLLLLFASVVVRSMRAEQSLSADKKEVTVSAVHSDKLLEHKPVRFAYQEFLPPQETRTLPIILIHGSPGDSSVLTDLAKDLSRERRVIVPDLPGFGDSTREIPDYSFRAHAFYIRQLADELKLEKFHALGFSMGGGVVLTLNELEPNRIASTTMLSAIGVQEYELLGDYYLNHILHGIQLAALWSVRELTPHFGYFDRVIFGVPYARNFFDSDQRPLRDTLQTIESPFLIVHGKRDPLVPVSAAREHFRLVPNSEYQELDDNHFMAFMRPEKIAPIVAAFLAKVESGAAKTRSNAEGQRIVDADAPFVREMTMADGSTAFVFFLTLVLATFISDDLTVLIAGALAGQGRISLTLAITACLVGVFIGDILVYLTGRWFGRSAVRRAPLRWFVKESSLERATVWLEKNGFSAIFISRFVPALRLPLYFAAGTAATNFWTYALFFLIADLMYVPLLVGATWWFSSGMMGMMGLPMFTGNFWLGMAVFIGAAFVLLNVGMRLLTWRGRRLLVGTFKRWTEWEFWSLRTFYFPVVVYYLWLAVKFRSFSVFADANPAIEASGFVGESKREIYDALQNSPAAEKHLLSYIFIQSELSATEKINAAREFMREHSLVFPLALKPNAGERGAGVFLVKTEAELKSRLETAETDLILQEFAAGDEFSVFYYRYPNEERGQIFAITEKQFPSVVGDGTATVETLILRDQRAVALANSYFERNSDKLDYIPAAGEKISLIDIGTHSKGAIFLDGDWVKTTALECEIDNVCRDFAGFYFGRFDLRSASVEDFGRGEFKIIELNGVTSEATNIYDLQYTLFNAYRILFRQWHIAFEIGAVNRKQGVSATSLRLLAKLLFQSWFGKPKERKVMVQTTASLASK
jgi:pimeloyl-ACP methyl ester carboxylesterase/membrane protein DedA with SNARE-associated domain